MYGRIKRTRIFRAFNKQSTVPTVEFLLEINETGDFVYIGKLLEMILPHISSSQTDAVSFIRVANSNSPVELFAHLVISLARYVGNDIGFFDIQFSDDALGYLVKIEYEDHETLIYTG